MPRLRGERLSERLVSVMVAAWAFQALAWPCSGSAAPPAGQLVLDESAYVQAYYQFGTDRVDTALLKSRGDELAGQKGMKALQRVTKVLLAEKRIDWKTRDWRDVAVMAFYPSNSSGAGVDRYRARFARAPPRRATGSRRVLTVRSGPGCAVRNWWERKADTAGRT